MAFICVILSWTPVAFPYKSMESVQKYTVRHTSRLFYNFSNNLKTDSGYMIRSNDRNINFPSQFNLENFTLATNVFHKCQIERTTFCGIPLINPYETIEGTQFLLGSVPRFRNNEVEVYVDRVMANNFKKTITFDMKISGPTYIFIVITPIKIKTIIAYSGKFQFQNEVYQPLFLRIISNTDYSKSNLTLTFSVSIKENL